MEFSTKKICSLKDAKAFFLSMGCSSFHMSREYPDRHAEYKHLRIPESKEQEWRRENFMRLAEELCNNETENSELWSLHSHMADLCKELETDETIQAIHLATERIFDRLPTLGKLLVAETIIGRATVECKLGLIFLSSKLNQPKIAKRFYEIAIDLIKLCRDSGVETERCQRALDICREIRDVLEMP